MAEDISHLDPLEEAASEGRRILIVSCNAIGDLRTPLVIPDTPEVRERFWANVTPGGPEECWEWQGPRLEPLGYGILNHEKKRLRANRVAYALLVGEIPPGMFVCHHCDNPPCVNPSHLFAGTPADNLRDMRRKGRGKWPGVPGNKHRAKVSPADVRTIRTAVEKGEASYAELAARYGISRTAVHAIVHRKYWSDVA